MNIKPLATGCTVLALLLFGISQTLTEPERTIVPLEPERTVVLQEVREPEEPEAVSTLDPAEVELIGRTIWGEAEGVKSEAERAAVAWCILNRVDTYGQTVEEVVTEPNQFQGYRTGGKCPQRHLDLAADVLNRWTAEQNGAEDVGRVLPADYLYFIGDGKRNHFTIEYQAADYWDWSLDNPYIAN